MPLEMSVRFKFVETQAYILPTDDESSWRAEPVGEHPIPVRNKWVYVFQTRTRGAPPAAGTPSKLHRACFCDGSRASNDANEKLIHMIDGDRAKREATNDLNNLSAVTPVDAVSLEDAGGGEQCFYYFFATSIQLGPDTIRQLEGNISKYLPAVNLPDVDASVPRNVRRDVWEVPVVDPITIAYTFRALYVRTADDVVVFAMDVEDATAKQRSEARARGSKLFLARYTKAILDADSEAKLVTESTKRAALGRIDAYLAKEGAQEKKLFNAREAQAFVLTRWLRGNLFLIVEAAHREREQFVYDQFVRAMAGVTDRLIEAAEGKAFLSQFAQTHTHLVDEYLVRKVAWPTDWQFATYKKCAGAALSLLKDHWLVKVAESFKADPKTARDVVDNFNRLAGKTVLTIEKIEGVKVPLRKTAGTHFVTRTLERIVQVPGETVPFEDWVRERKGQVSTLSFTLDAFNTVINLSKFMDAIDKGDREAFFAGLKVAGNAANVVKAIGGVRDARWTARGDKVFSARFRGTAGFLAAIIDMVFAVKDGVAAFRRGDVAATVGNLLLYGGSVLTLMGAMFTFAGNSAAAGPVTFIGALAAMAGALVIELLSDTDIETFVKFCTFGDRNVRLNGSASEQPAFSATNVHEWDESDVGLRKQLDALYALCGGFSFKAIGPLPRKVPFAVKTGTTIEIDLGDVPLGARLRLSFRCNFFSREGLKPDLVIDPLAELADSVQVLGQSSANRVAEVNFARFDRGGRTVYQIEIDWPNHTASLPNQSTLPPDLSETWIEAHFDVFGDGSTMLPPKGPLRGQTYRAPQPFFDHVYRSAAA